jgi:rubrerythrin
MQSKVDRSSIQELFARLASIEEKHEQAIFDHYARHVDGSLDRERFESQVVVPAMEGGLSQEEYLNRFQADLGSESEVVDLAMSIEGQALDLYLRAAERSGAEESRDFLRKMADEERQHLNRLGQLLDDRIEASQ